MPFDLDSAWNQSDVRMMLLHEYYELLNKNRRFQRELEELRLLSRRYPKFKKNPPCDTEKQYIEYMSSKGTAIPNESYPHQELQDAVKAFAQKWKLPERSWKTIGSVDGADIWQSIRMWRNTSRGEKPKLSLGPFGGISLIGPRKVAVAGISFDFDPTHRSVTWAQKKVAEMAEKIKQDAVSQVEAIAKEARSWGWTNLPIRYRDRAEMRIVVRRLYEKVVLERTWAQIAKTHHRTCDAIREGVYRMSTLLGIPLDSKPGRPPKVRRTRSS